MAAATTVVGWPGTYAPGAHITPPYYADFMRENLFPNLYFRQLGTLTVIPHGHGDKVKIPRWDSPITNSAGYSTLNNNVTAITEVTEGDPSTVQTKGLSGESITGDVTQFVGARTYSDKLILITRANYLEGALEALTRELAFRLDRYTRRNISASGTVRHAGSGATAATGDYLFGKEIAKIAPYMDAANVPRWDDDTLVGVANPLVQYDMYRDPSAQGFVSVRRYNDAIDIYRGEIGEHFGVRWLMSSAIPRLLGGATAKGVSAAGISGAASYIFAPDAFYSIELENGGVEVIHHPPGSGGSTGDPGNMVGSIAVKVWYGVTAAPSADSRLMIFGHDLGLNF